MDARNSAALDSAEEGTVVSFLRGYDERINVKCFSCLIFFSTDQLFYCLQCKELQCSDCVFEEIDSYFCGNCLNNYPSSEAKRNGFTCKLCFMCPACGSSLRCHDEEEAKKKTFFCRFCHWTCTADENEESNLFSFTDEFFKISRKLIDDFSKRLRGEKLSNIARDSIGAVKSLAEKYHLHLDSAKLSRMRNELISLDSESEFSEKYSTYSPTAINELPMELYEEDATSIDERIRNPDTYLKRNLRRSPYLLSVKRVKMCWKCETVLVKPEFMPTSTKFRVNYNMRSIVPYCYVVEDSVFYDEKEKLFGCLLKIKNRHDREITMRILPVKQDDISLQFPAEDIVLRAHTQLGTDESSLLWKQAEKLKEDRKSSFVNQGNWAFALLTFSMKPKRNETANIPKELLFDCVLKSRSFGEEATEFEMQYQVQIRI